MMLRLLGRFSVSKQREFSRYFLVSYKYTEDAYYKTVFTSEDHSKLLKKFQQKHPVHILGGEKFPMEGSYLLFNCDDQAIPLKFIDEDPYIKSKIVTSHELIQLNKESSEKFSRLSDFYSAY